MFTHSKERMVKKGAKQNVHPQVMCGVDIKRLLNVIFYLILMNLMFKMSLVSSTNFINITLIKMM